MTQAGHETNTGNAEATAASGVMAHQYELMLVLKAEAEKLNARYNLAYDAINDALPLHPICRANKFTGEAHYWDQFEKTSHLRMNPLAPNYDYICEKIRRQYEARERARKESDLTSLIERVDEADARWMDIEAQIMDAPVFTVGDARIKLTVLKQYMDPDCPEGQEMRLLETCEQLIALRTGG